MILTLSCSDDTVTAPLDIEFQGVTLLSDDDGFTYTGNVPAEGIDFIIMSSKTLSKIIVDRTVCWDENGLPQLSGYWGNISISLSGASFISNIHLNENSVRNRTITLKYGDANEYCLINLFQIVR